MGAQVISFFRPNPLRSDWTSEELAELYRIEHALINARLTVETDRGITDEGDPWFIFCRRDGEVLVHISRTDHEYLLHSPGLERPLAGRSFRALSKSFVDRIPVQVPLRSNRGAQLFVHPAAMLAIIIGTIFVAADDVHFSSRNQTDDGAPGSAADGPRAMASFQTAFQSYIESFIDNLREWNSSESSSYLNLIGTVAAFVLAVATADIIHPSVSIPDLTELVSGWAGDQATVAVADGDAPSAADAIAIGSKVVALAAPQDVPGVDAIATPADQDANADAPPASKNAPATLDPSAAHNKVADIDGANESSGSDSAQFKTAQEPVVTDPDSSGDHGLLANLPTIDIVTNSDPTKPAPIATADANAVTGSSEFFNNFVNNLKTSVPVGLVQSNDQPLITVVSHVEALAPATQGPTTAAVGSLLIGSPDPQSISATYHADAGDIPLFNMAAAATINAFIKANPSAEIISEQGAIIIYDGLTSLDQSAALTVQVWEASTKGPIIALVGHADHGPVA